MKVIRTSYLLLSLSLLISACSTPGEPVKESPATTGHKAYAMPRTEVIPLRDGKNERQYELYVKLPESYTEDEEKRFPVIYFTDAVWHIDILSAAAEYIMPDAILVGISWQTDMVDSLVKERGAHVSRFRDYSVLPHDRPEIQAKYQMGQASEHLEFIKNEVFGHIETNYRTQPEHRSYFGYSLGGVFGAYTLLTQPETFNNYILGSPALRGDIPYLSGLEEKPTQANVFISYGTEEQEAAVYIDQLIALLSGRNDPNLNLHHQIIEGNHSTGFPATGTTAVSWLAGLMKE